MHYCRMCTARSSSCRGSPSGTLKTRHPPGPGTPLKPDPPWDQGPPDQAPPQEPDPPWDQGPPDQAPPQEPDPPGPGTPTPGPGIPPVDRQTPVNI